MSFKLRFLFFIVIFLSPLIAGNNKKFSVATLPVNGRSEIFLIERKGEEFFRMKNISKNFPGFNYDPYLFFCNDSPSVIWVNRNKGIQSLIIYSNEKFTQYILSLPFEVSSPLVEIDIYGRPILIVSSPSGIFYAFLEKGVLNFNSFFQSPSFFVSAKRDERGILWVAWAGFDGNDWEIYFTKWDGENFGLIERITDNNFQDIEPSITLEPFDIMWKSYKDGESIIRSMKGTVSEEKRMDEPFEIDKNSFIAFGDSITYGMVDYKPDAEGYVPRLERLLKENYSKEMKVLNRGIPGEDTVKGLSRIESVIKDDPSRYILIMEGTNDVWHYPAWFTALNLEGMLKISFSYKMKPLLANLIPKAFWAEYLNPRIEEINKFILELSDKYKVPLVDQYNAFMSYPEEKGGWRALYSGHNHPNEEGYQLMAGVWYDAISKLPRFKEEKGDRRDGKSKKDKFNFNN